MQETQVWSLGREDALEEEMATHSSVLAWRIPGIGEPGGLPSIGSHRVGRTWLKQLSSSSSSKLSKAYRVSFWGTVYFVPYRALFGEGNGTPLQYSCLENPWTEEPGRLQSMGSLRVRNDWATSLSLFTFMHWRRKWQPTPVFLPGESQGRGNLVGCSLWGRTESDTTEAT